MEGGGVSEHLHMNRPRADFVTKLITREEWKLVCKIRQAEVCSLKVKFFSKDEALREIVRKMSRLDDPAPLLRTYECEICTHWHLTSRPLNKKPQQPT